MLSFHNDPLIKTSLVARMDAHAAADEITQGVGWENGKGCFIGCSLDDYNHARWPTDLGLPEWLARLCDSIFEGLKNGEAKAFATELPRRIPVGVDLEPVQHWLAMTRIDRMLVTQRKALEAKHAYGVTEAIQQTIAALEVGRRAHEAAVGGNACDLPAAWSAAWSAASAAESAAWSVAWPAAASAARSAASAAWSAARSAAWSVAASAAWSEAASATWSAAESAARSAAWSAAESAAWSEAESVAWPEAASAAESAAWKQERDDLFTALDRAGGAR